VSFRESIKKCIIGVEIKEKVVENKAMEFFGKFIEPPFKPISIDEIAERAEELASLSESCETDSIIHKKQFNPAELKDSIQRIVFACSSLLLVAGRAMNELKVNDQGNEEEE
jgi:hypothetical protein